MVLWLIFILLTTLSSKQIVLFSTFLIIINTFFIVVAMQIIKMVYLNSPYGRFLKCPVSRWFTCLFLRKTALIKICTQWLIVILPIFIIIFPIMWSSHLIISSLTLNFCLTIFRIFMSWGVTFTYWIPCFNKAVHSQNYSHTLVVASLLDSVQIIQLVFLWSSN